jgi:glycogen debranching enzyme
VPIDTVSILDGNTFVVSDRRGDIDATPIDNHGLFLDDTRFLSRWILTINGRRPAVLSIDDQATFKLQFFQALTTGTVYVDSHLSVTRRRAISRGFREEIEITNHDKEAIALDVKLEAAADFADLFEVKDKLEKKGETYSKLTNGTLTLGYQREGFMRETRITPNQKGDTRKDGFSFHVQLQPRTAWSVGVEVQAASRIEAAEAGESISLSQEEVDEWVRAAPRLIGTWEPLHQIYRRSLIDMAALRFRTGIVPGALPAAGLPWFMAIFGRDSLIASYQAMPFAPELAESTLRALALFPTSAAPTRRCCS